MTLCGCYTRTNLPPPRKHSEDKGARQAPCRALHTPSPPTNTHADSTPTLGVAVNQYTPVLFTEGSGPQGQRGPSGSAERTGPGSKVGCSKKPRCPTPGPLARLCVTHHFSRCLTHGTGSLWFYLLTIDYFNNFINQSPCSTASPNLWLYEKVLLLLLESEGLMSSTIFMDITPWTLGPRGFWESRGPRSKG